MKSFLTALSTAALLSFALASTSVIAATPDQAVACNTEYAACLRSSANMSVKDASTNWAGCNAALAACYKM
jgi:hypothetical protein